MLATQASLDDERINEPPLRLLVIGDSLAAGVGMSQSSTPALPQSIAQALSKAMGGRAVYWTCLGTPGMSASETVQEIYNLQVDTPQSTPMIQSFVDWQNKSRQAAKERLQIAKLKAQEFWELHKELIEDADQQEKTSEKGIHRQEPRNPILKRLRRSRTLLQKDLKNLRRILEQNETVENSKRQNTMELERDGKQANNVGSKVSLNAEEETVPPESNKQVTRRNSIDRELVQQYDVAVVLTGLNDLKDAFLPFMMSPQRARRLEETTKGNIEGGLKGELVRIVHALGSKMGIRSLSDSEVSRPKDESMTKDLSPHHYQQERERNPLIVLPALPFSPIELCQISPLKYFVVPLIRAMDHNKQVLARRYSDLVCYVESPDSNVFSDAEARRGDLWEDSQTDRVLLNMTDVGLNVQERVEALMREHYKHEDEEDNCLYKLDDAGDGFVSIAKYELNRGHPGSSMVAQDGVHPNDAGYDMWGRYIAHAVVDHWERRANRQGDSFKAEPSGNC